MRAESHTASVAGAAAAVRDRLHLFGSARSEIPIVSSTRPAAGYGATSTLHLVSSSTLACTPTFARWPHRLPTASTPRSSAASHRARRSPVTPRSQPCARSRLLRATGRSVPTISDPTALSVSHDASPTDSSRPT